MEDTTNKLNLEQDLVEERVAIVGGGISGMLCKKWLKELNIDSDLYEEKESFFGIWDQKEGKTWDNMKTNLSQYCCQFSDHFWDICQPYLPTNVEVRKYLSDYVSKFGLNEGNNFFKTSVKKVVKEETTGYYVLELYDIIKEKLYIKKYKKVLIASGLHNSYEIPHFKGFENFTGDYIHSAQYKSPAGYEKKRVLIVGMSLSGGNISDAIGEVNESQVFLSCKVPAYIQKNEIVDKVTGRRSTVDSRQIKRRNDELNDFYDNPINIYDRIWGVAQATMQNYSEIECLKINYGEVLRICFSDNLVDFVRNKKVIITSEIKEFHSGNIVEFIDGRKEQIDSIIFCTGYKNCLKYIDEKILQDIQFDYDNYLYPIIAYRGIYHKNHKNLLFVGMHNGIFWTGMELQARYATGLLSGKYEYPDEKKYEEVIEKETKYKDYQSKTKVKMTYPYVDYLETIANDMGVRPDLSKIKTEDYELYVALKTVLPIGVSYRINKEDPHMEENIKYLKRIAKEY